MELTNMDLVLSQSVLEMVKVQMKIFGGVRCILDN